jgi:hypothetical protein
MSLVLGDAHKSLDERINSIPYPPLTSNPEENLKGCSGYLFMHNLHKHLLAAF